MLKNYPKASISNTFAKFQRVVRDISREQDKKISLEVYGEDCELDKSMVEQLNEFGSQRH